MGGGKAPLSRQAGGESGGEEQGVHESQASTFGGVEAEEEGFPRQTLQAVQRDEAAEGHVRDVGHQSLNIAQHYGVSDLIIVETKDAILVAEKNKEQDIKSVVNQLKSSNRTEYKAHREVYRPWGKYDSIDFGQRDQVKRITVKPGEKLSIQKHHHRAEHWIVVSGTAQVLNGEKTILLTENQSTYIPLGQIHALENPGKIPLEIIEVQTGSYLGEDDIVRFEDRYGRA